MKYEESVGALIVYNNEFLLLKDGNGYWGFAKGHIEPGEELLSTMKREVFEETGINDFILVSEFKEEIGYYFKNKGLVSKKVTFYLIKSKNKNVKLSREHVSYAWLKLSDALKQASFENTKRIIRKAAEFLKLS